MKKLLLLLSIIILINMTAYSATAADIFDPLEHFLGHHEIFFDPYINRMYSSFSVYEIFAEYLGIDVEKFIQERIEKRNRMGHGKNDAPYLNSLMDTTNLYWTIIEYNIPDDVIIRAFQYSNGLVQGLIERFNDDYYRRDIFTDDEINALLSRNEATILKAFASDYSIVVNERIFSAAWVYTRSIEEIKAAGITSTMLEEKLHLYAEFSFTEEATLAFEAKLSEFLGRDIVLINERVLTTFDALTILRAIAGLTAMTDEEMARFGISGAPSTADALEVLRIVAGL
jgi:hypothetical protein